MTVNDTSPLVVIANVAEAFCDFLSRDPDPDTRSFRIRTEQYRGDRALIWAGDPKLVVTSFPVPSLDYVRQILGFHGTEAVHPVHPSARLCSDVLRESTLFDRLVEYAGSTKTLTLIPYATTPQFLELVEALQTRGGLNVLLPETASSSSQWLLHYLDTKAGFRALVSGWLSNSTVQLPEGFICQTPEEAAQVTRWFVDQSRPCIIKANMGTNGYGNFIVYPDNFSSEKQIAERIRSNPFFSTDLIVVEELIVANTVVSPSFECFVPSVHEGPPRMTYMSTQLFHGYGDFCGVITSREQQIEPWYTPLVEAGLTVARRLQKMGYVGHFDMDAIVDDTGRPYPVEINPRRTGGTHVHDFASFAFGSDYLEHVALLSRDPVMTGSITTFGELIRVLDGLLYPSNGRRRGIIPTVSSSIHEGEFGCLIVGSSMAEVLEIQSEMLKHLGSESP